MLGRFVAHTRGLKSSLVILQILCFDFVVCAVWLALARTRFQKTAAWFIQIYFAVRVITVNLAVRGYFPYGEISHEDSEYYHTVLMVPFICAAMYTPYHYLIPTLYLLPLNLLGNYWLQLALYQLKLDAGVMALEVSFSAVASSHLTYSAIIAYNAYGKQHEVAELIIKNAILIEEQNDVKQILHSSSDGILVLEKDPEPAKDADTLKSRTRFYNKRLHDIVENKKD